MKKSFFLASIFLSQIVFSDESPLPACSDALCTTSRNLFLPRSFSAYSSRQILMLKTLYQNEISREFWQGTFAVAPEYMQNFYNPGTCNCNNLGSLPFWSGTNTMTYGGHDGTTDFDPYQFGVGDVIGTGSLTLNVDISHVASDLLLHMVYHKDKPGFYFTIRAPLGAMSVTPTLCEKIAPQDEVANAETTSIWLSYPSAGNRFDSMTQAFQAGSVSTLDAQVTVASSLHRAFALDNGRVAACKQTVIRLADLSLALGYQFIATPQGFLGAGIKFTMPTGNVPTGKYMLEPIFGRAGYWGVGFEALSHYKIWEHAKRDRGLDFWINGELLHLCSGRRPNMRSFDLALNGPGSKYLLLQKYYLSVPDASNTSGAVPSFITQAVNVTTLPVISRFNLEGNFAFLFDFHERNLNFALGAEMWGRSQERLTLDACHLLHVNAADLNQFAVLGRQVSDDAQAWDLDPSQVILSLHLCEPLARINQSIDRVISPTNPATPPLVYPTDIPDGVEDARLSTNRIPANLNEALDIAGAQAARAMSARIYGQFGYTWKDLYLTPQVSLIGSVEFAPGGHNALNLWSVGAQGSINF